MLKPSTKLIFEKLYKGLNIDISGIIMETNIATKIAILFIFKSKSKLNLNKTNCSTTYASRVVINSPKTQPGMI